MMQPTGYETPPGLEPLDFPLCGSQLIEASAGTGKTWTIAALYLRLVLGHGALGAPPRLPSEILVLTFTEAASQELRDRIRSRLSEAARFFNQDSVQPGDSFLVDLRGSYEESVWPACARVLDLAAQSMDEAAISTIHAWCARMLQEHAFDSGSLFTQSLEADLAALELEAVWDYWRSFCTSMEVGDAAQMQAWWKGPGDLYRAIRNELHKDTSLTPGADGPAQLLARAREEAQTVLEGLKAFWRVWVEDLDGVLTGLGKAISIRPNDQKRWLDAMRDWANDPEAQSLDIKTGWERLSQAGINAAWKGEGPAPENSVFTRVTALHEALTGLPDGYAQVWSHALAWCVQRLHQSLAQRAQMGFDGLLSNLDDALGGANGVRLAQVLRAQYPVVLIDEFQDTDPVQYRIFDQIYEIADNRQDLCLVLIGDPKQAIYGFRGADIHAYLRARTACAARLHTLSRNYRSSQAMVEAVNACFGRAESSREEGAFLSPDRHSRDIPFFPVQAKGREEAWVIDGGAQAALSVCEIQADEPGEALTVSAYETRSAQWCAAQVAEVLNLGQQGRAGFESAEGFRAVRPADIAVLVNSHKEAATLRAALAARQVRSVYLSERESVYDSAQAGELQYWLAACAQPSDGRALRTALATPTLGLTWADIDRINTDEQAWEETVLRFQAYRDCWQHRGVLPMLRRLLNDFEVPVRLLSAADRALGERALTNILHLAELLQRASVQLDGEQALMRYLAEQRLDTEGRTAGGDAQQIRLESDADLVRVVTVHKSKGLEYPLVFLPFACKARMRRGTDIPLILTNKQGQRALVFDPSPEHIEQAERERLAEDVRKLYVALTRARHAVWMTVGKLRNISDNSAAAYVLSGELGIADAMRALAAEHSEIAVLAPEAPGDAVFEQQTDALVLGTARVPLRSARESWWISSYSAMHVDEAGARAWRAADTAVEDVFLEAHREEAKADEAGSDHLEGLSLHSFPRGSEAGTFLHSLLEWAARQGFSQIKAEPAQLRDMVARRCALRGWEPWIDFLCDWLLRCVQTRMEPEATVCTALSMDDLEASSPEMEFWLPVSHVDVQQLDALVCRETFSAAPRPHLASMSLDGMFKGFMDLVLMHEGRYYVVDYKSNWLGPNNASYTQEAMRQAMLGARYDMQYVLYVLALHRQLRARLANYDYDQHMGGALYLFLRGLDAPGQGVFADRPARSLIEALDRLFAGRGDGA